MAEPKQQLTWLLMNWPPFIRMQDDKLIGGVTGEQMKLLFANLPEYEHHTQQVSLIRLQTELRSDRQVCSMPIQKTPQREASMLFTEAIDVGLGNRLYVRADTAALLGSQPSIALAQIVNRPDLRGVVYRGRSYGAPIDQLLASPGAASNLQTLVLESDSVLKMLEAARIDYVIEYPVVIRYWEHQQRQPRAAFHAYRIAGADDFSLGYIACSKTEWGAQAVARINAAFKQLIQRPDYKPLHYTELTDAEQTEYRQHWQQYIRKNGARN